MTDPTDDDARTAAAMLAAGGLSVHDISRHLHAHPEQVRRWLGMPARRTLHLSSKSEGETDDGQGKTNR